LVFFAFFQREDVKCNEIDVGSVYVEHPNQTRFLKGWSIIDNVFLAFEAMEWAMESEQPLLI